MSKTEEKDYIKEYTDKHADKVEVVYVDNQEEIEMDGLAVYVLDWDNETKTIIIDTSLKEAFFKADAIGDPYGIKKVRVYLVCSLMGMMLDEQNKDESITADFEFCNNHLREM